MKNLIKKLSTITFLLNLIFLGCVEADGQTIASDSIIEFVCFRYDGNGGNVPSVAPSSTETTKITLKVALPPSKRTTWEDIIMERSEYDLEKF